MRDLIQHHDIATGIDIDQPKDPRDEDAEVREHQDGPTSAKLTLVAHGFASSNTR